MNPVIIKIGGKPASTITIIENLIEDIIRLKAKEPVILVHGGGADVSKMTTIMGLTPVFKDGIRQTSSEEMEIVDSVLAGKVNKQLVRIFQKKGSVAAGISGCDAKTFTGIPIAQDNCTGKVTSVSLKLLKSLLDAGISPVISSVSMTESGSPLNINADEAALALAEAFPASALVFISDIAGILKNKEVIPSISAEQIEEEIQAEVISGGMIPKVRASVKALKSGTQQVIIGGYENKKDLCLLLEGKKGTIIKEKNNE